VTADPHRGWFKLQSCGWNGIRRQLDANGVPTSTRVLSPFQLTRAIDAASPVLYEAMRSNTVLGITISSDVVAEGVFRPTTTWTLKTARVASISMSASSGGSASVVENVVLVYGEVAVVHEPSKVSYIDSTGITA
jgi:type VI secretion system Hcp family effector